MPYIIVIVIIVIGLVILALGIAGLVAICLAVGWSIAGLGDLWAKPVLLLGLPPSLGWGLMGFFWGTIGIVIRELRKLRAAQAWKIVLASSLSFWGFLWIVAPWKPPLRHLGTGGVTPTASPPSYPATPPSLPTAPAPPSTPTPEAEETPQRAEESAPSGQLNQGVSEQVSKAVDDRAPLMTESPAPSASTVPPATPTPSVTPAPSAAEPAPRPAPEAQVAQADSLENRPKAQTPAGSSGERLDASKRALQEAGYAFTESDFLRAVREGDLRAVKLFLQAGMSPDAGNALTQAVLWHQRRIAELLVQAGANVNVEMTSPEYAREYESLLVYVVVNRHWYDLATQMVRRGANPNVYHYYDGKKPLVLNVMMSALWSRDEAALELLEAMVEAGVDLKARKVPCGWGENCSAVEIFTDTCSRRPDDPICARLRRIFSR